VTNDGKTVKIVDFNVSRKKTSEEFRMMTKTGTLAFSAPEMFT
jgi:serine/threonine protein kinase